MSRSVLDKLLHAVVVTDSYFEQRVDTTLRFGLFFAIQKVTAALRVFGN